MVNVGNLVKTDQTMLTTIVALDPIYVYFDVNERTLLRLRRLVQEGQMKSREQGELPVLIALSDETNFPHTGVIDFSENTLERGDGNVARASDDRQPETEAAADDAVFVARHVRSGALAGWGTAAIAAARRVGDRHRSRTEIRLRRQQQERGGSSPGQGRLVASRQTDDRRGLDGQRSRGRQRPSARSTGAKVDAKPAAKDAAPEVADKDETESKPAKSTSGG